MSENKEQKKIKKIREYILKSGFPLEIEIGNILRKNGWLVGNQWPYVDKESKKIRPVDVLAMKLQFQPPILGVVLLIECKKSLKHDWVFHTQEREKEFLPVLGTLGDFLKKIYSVPLADELAKLTAADIKASKLTDLHLLNNSIKIGVFNIIPSSKDKDDFYEAIKQITSALESMRETAKSTSAIVFPTIVFDGEMFEFYQENSETKIQPINHLLFMTFSEAPSGMFPCLVDVVRKTYFSEFLRMMERDFYILTELFKMKGVEP
jgi:hypothetical protein